MDDWHKPLVQYLRNPQLPVDRKIKYRVENFVILGDYLFKSSINDTLLQYLGETKAYVTLANMREGICGSHQANEKMKWMLFRLGIYWPIALKDCINYEKSCEECQKHDPMQQVSASELHSILKPWPFLCCAINLIGQIHPSSLKGHKYILVAINYFTKLVEDFPLKNVNHYMLLWFLTVDTCISTLYVEKSLTTIFMHLIKNYVFNDSLFSL